MSAIPLEFCAHFKQKQPNPRIPFWRSMCHSLYLVPTTISIRVPNAITAHSQGLTHSCFERCPSICAGWKDPIFSSTNYILPFIGKFYKPFRIYLCILYRYFLHKISQFAINVPKYPLLYHWFVISPLLYIKLLWMQMSVSRLHILFHQSICLLFILSWLCGMPEYMVSYSCTLYLSIYMSDSVY